MRSWLIVLLLCLGPWLSATAWATERPNLVLVIGDDHGWPDSGFMGHPVVETPALDRLAEQGTVFSQAQNPVSICRPSLQTLLSGLHPRQWAAKRAALRADGPIPFRQEVAHYRTLPRELAREGYLSWEGGKMWEGSFSQAGFTHGMAAGPPVGGFRVEGDGLGRDGWDSSRCGPTRTLDEPCPALDVVSQFLDEAADERFLLWFAPMLPHVPFDPPDEFRALYRDRGLTPGEELYFAQVTRLDAAIGELLRELDARDLTRDTLIVYVSDNGWQVDQGFFGNFGHGKGSLHALGVRTPIVFHWPGRVPAGRVRDDLVMTEDLFATLLDYGGAEPLPDRWGQSLRPTIERGVSARLDAYVSSFYGVAPEYRGHFVRGFRWRYISSRDGREQLYDIRADPFEQLDLIGAHPQVAEEMRDAIEQWERDIEVAPDELEIVGELVDAVGEPIVGGAVVLRSGSIELASLTGPGGGFRFRNLPSGEYTLGPGPRVVSFAEPIVTTLPIGPTGRYVGRVRAEPGASLRRPPDSALSGRLRTPGGRGLGDIVVRVRKLGWPIFEDVEVVVRSDRNGRYLAENLPAGLYLVHADVPAPLRAAWALARVRAGGHAVRDLIASKPRRLARRGCDPTSDSRRCRRAARSQPGG